MHAEGEVISIASVPVLAFAGTLNGWVSLMMRITGSAFTVSFKTPHSARVRYAIGIASAFGIPTALAGAISFILAGLDHPNGPDWALGYVHLLAFLGIIALSTMFARLGVHFAHALTKKMLQRLFAFFLAIHFIHLIWNAVV